MAYRCLRSAHPLQRSTMICSDWNISVARAHQRVNRLRDTQESLVQVENEPNVVDAEESSADGSSDEQHIVAGVI